MIRLFSLEASSLELQLINKICEITHTKIDTLSEHFWKMSRVVLELSVKNETLVRLLFLSLVSIWLCLSCLSYEKNS